ncbi:hypothetical protein Tco_0831435 [Tanacetum coccineum]
MHTRASNFELVEPLPEPECTLNRRLRRRNRRVPYDQRNNPTQHPRIVHPPILDINYFLHFLDILRHYDPMDDEPIWAADCVVAPTLGFAITIPETSNKFSIKEDSEVPLLLRRTFLHTADAVIRVKEKQLNLGVGTERMIINIDSAMKHSYSNDDTHFRTLLEEEIFSEFNEFMEMTADENSESESDTEEPPFEKITINTDFKIKTSLEEPPTDL